MAFSIGQQDTDDTGMISTPPPTIDSFSTSTLGADDASAEVNSIPVFQQTENPFTLALQKILQDKPPINPNQIPDQSKKDLELVSKKAVDIATAKAEERLGAQLDQIPFAPNMKPPGNYKIDKQLQSKINKEAFGNPNYARAQRMPYYLRGWNVARANLYDTY